MEQLINGVAEKDRATMLTTFNSYIDVDGNANECSVQSWEMINAVFANEVRREKEDSQSRGGDSRMGAHGVPLLM